MSGKKPTFTVVGPDSAAPEQPSSTGRKALIDLLKSDDKRELLVAMRDRVATALADPNTPARDLAALTRRQMEIAREIAAMDVESKQEAAEDAEAADEDFDASAV